MMSKSKPAEMRKCAVARIQRRIQNGNLQSVFAQSQPSTVYSAEMDTKIKVPRALEAKIMLWTDVTYHDMEEIDKTQSIPELESVLSRVFQVDLPEPKRGIMLKLYVQTVIHCRKLSFKKEQTSALLSIIKSIHEANVETPLNNIEHCFKYCKELLLYHSVRWPPFSINLFNYEEVNCLLNYIYNSYLKHYKLYKYIFTPQIKLDLTLTYHGIPDQDEPIMENSSDGEKAAEKEVPKTDGSPETQEPSVVGPVGSTLGSNKELKALIEKEVREQMMHVSGHLDQQMEKMADQHDRALQSQRSHKTKK